MPIFPLLSYFNTKLRANLRNFDLNIDFDREQQSVDISYLRKDSISH